MWSGYNQTISSWMAMSLIAIRYRSTAKHRSVWTSSNRDWSCERVPRHPQKDLPECKDLVPRRQSRHSLEVVCREASWDWFFARLLYTRFPASAWAWDWLRTLYRTYQVRRSVYLPRKHRLKTLCIVLSWSLGCKWYLQPQTQHSNDDENRHEQDDQSIHQWLYVFAHTSL